MVEVTSGRLAMWCVSRRLAPVSINWTDYKPFDPGVTSALHEVPRRDAKAEFDRLMAAKEARIAELDRLLQANGLGLDDSPDASPDSTSGSATRSAGLRNCPIGYGPCGTRWSTISPST